jgi:hypothetical protein
MANADSAFGLYPADGDCYIRPFYIPASYGTALFIGDPVVVVTGGGNAAAITVPGMGAFPAGSLRTINVGVAGAPITGAIVSFSALASSPTTIHNPASTERIAMVACDPKSEFYIQEVSGGIALTATAVGLAADFVSGTGSTATGRSGYELNNVGEAAGTALQLRILGLKNAPNNALGEHAVWRVRIDKHTDALQGGAGGI